MKPKPDIHQRALRVDAGLTVRFREVEREFLSASLGKNISETGLCIPLTHLPSGPLLGVDIRSKDCKSSLKAVARIAWIANRDDVKFPYEAGLEFLGLGPAQRELLARFVARPAALDGKHDIRWID